MSVDISTPVSAIEGIGPALEARLNAIEVRTVFDLLRGTIGQIHGAVASHASVGQVRAWREMAQLLQVRNLTPQWAEALREGGIVSLETLRAKTPAELTTLFNDAVESGIIPAAPDAAALFTMILDAAEIHFTGVVMGTVLDAADQGVAAASVRSGGQSTTTDSRGRFRLPRIPLGRAQRLVVVKDGYQTATIDDAPVQRQEDIVRRETVRLLPVPAHAVATGRLDEFDGDEVPVLSEHAMTTQRRDVADLRAGDVLVLHKMFASGTEALLATKFRAYENGRFVIYTWKVPLSDLPPGAAAREHFRYRRGAFERFALTTSRLRLLLQLRRMRRAFRGSPPAQTLMEFDVTMAERASFLRELEGA